MNALLVFLSIAVPCQCAQPVQIPAVIWLLVFLLVSVAVGVFVGKRIKKKSVSFEEKGAVKKSKIILVVGLSLFVFLALVGITMLIVTAQENSGGRDWKKKNYYEPSNSSSTKRKSQSYSWIVGTWYVQTPYGTSSIRFEGDGSKGDVTELEDAQNPYSAKYGTYYVEDEVLYYNLRGEPGTSYIEIHSGQRLYMGGGYYYKKINR